MRQTCI